MRETVKELIGRDLAGDRPGAERLVEPSGQPLLMRSSRCGSGVKPADR